MDFHHYRTSWLSALSSFIGDHAGSRVELKYKKERVLVVIFKRIPKRIDDPAFVCGEKRGGLKCFSPLRGTNS